VFKKCRSPLLAFAEQHQTVSGHVCQVELDQFRPPQAGAKKDGKNGKIAPAAAGLVVAGDGE
jgi:hypothetical protein